MEESTNIMITSSNLLQFHVEDILGLAQIKAGKFQKNEEMINIERTVQEVVKIQEYNAKQKNINLTFQLTNFQARANLSGNRRPLSKATSSHPSVQSSVEQFTVLTDKKRFQ